MCEDFFGAARASGKELRVAHEHVRDESESSSIRCNALLPDPFNGGPERLQFAVYPAAFVGPLPSRGHRSPL